ncbi:hypothetical protein [Nocardia sp. NPDC051463]|uniref:hypothetical protein n=1 Tax=Nocardia sp. NPDC051463 TaxID=3154845 RepID=UPI00343AB993
MNARSAGGQEHSAAECGFSAPQRSARQRGALWLGHRSGRWWTVSKHGDIDTVVLGAYAKNLGDPD